MAGCLPNFFLAGVPKSGSTSLHHYLGQHPQIFMSPVKEPHYFAEEVRNAEFAPHVRRFAQSGSSPIRTWETYRSLFADVRDEKAIGESSVCYLWSPTAARNIAERIPGAKFLVVLRNPVDRAYSQYLQMLSFTEEPISFREHVERSLRSTSRQFSELYPFLELGLYGEQIERLFRTVPRSSVRIYFYEDYCRNAGGVLRDIFDFLEVDSRYLPDFSERRMTGRVPRSPAARRWLKRTGLWQFARFALPASVRAPIEQALYRPRRDFILGSADRAFVGEYYRRDLDLLSTLLNRDFRGWLPASFASTAVV